MISINIFFYKNYKMSKSKAAIKSFEMLRMSFARTTVPSNIEAFHADLNERIHAYNNLDS